MAGNITAVLLSGGLDSAVLVTEQAAQGEVQPIYVSVGLAWERAERDVVDHLLAHAPLAGRTRPVIALAADMRDVYAPSHWALEGRPPAYHTADEDVYLPGRNIVLLVKAATCCAAAGIHRLLLGTLAHNPFPDATPAFRDSLAHALSLGLDHPLTIEAPYAATSKASVVQRGLALGVPLRLTQSCMNPPGSGANAAQHCGLCSKCRERHDAFIEAAVDDPTNYADRRFIDARPRQR